MVTPTKNPKVGTATSPRQPKETRRRHHKTANSVASDEATKRRIVPEEFRKRTSVSCDLCKTRRVKCERSDGNDGPCKNCLKLNMPCQSALPRKKRIYGSVESLSERYRVLEDLVNKLLPQEDTDDTSNLVEIAKRLDLNQQTSPHHDIIQQSHPMAVGRQRSSTQGSAMAPTFQQPVTSLTNPAPTINPAGWSATPSLYHSGSQNDMASQQTLVGDRSDFNPFDKRSWSVEKPSSPMKEKLYPNTQGIHSYLGPSSSFKFMIKIRQMLASGGLDRGRVKAGIGHHAALNHQGSTAEAEKLRREFSKDTVSKIIDIPARDEAEQDDVDDQSTVDGSSLRDGSSATGSVAPNFVTAGSHRMGPGRPMSVATADEYNTAAPTNPINGLDLCESMRNILPDRETADALVEAFFNKVHPNYFVFHRGIFQQNFESFYIKSGVDGRETSRDQDGSPSTVDPAWACSVCMVLAFGAQALEHFDRQRSQRLQHRYSKLAQTTFYQVISQTSISSIQALLLLQLYQHNAGERNGAWIILGCACRMAVALGMHRESVAATLTPVDRELRRRVWCTLYMFEQDLCLILGRPSSIAEDEEVDTALPNEAMLDGGSVIPPLYLQHSLRLTRMSQRIRRAMFSAACTASSTQDMARAAQEGRGLHEGVDPTTSRGLLDQLDQWHKDLPSDLTLEHWSPGSSFFRSVHLLHLQFNLCKQALTRSYILQHVESQLNNDNGPAPQYPRSADLGSETDQDICEISLNSAIQSAAILERLRLSQQLDGVASQDIYYAYHCGIVLLISLLPDHQSSGHGEGATGPSTDRIREAVDCIVRIMQEPRLCKTMKLFSTVTLQLARIVGLQRNESIAGNAVIEQQQPFIADMESQQWQNPDSFNYEASILLSNDWLDKFLAGPDPYAYQTTPNFVPGTMNPQLEPILDPGQYPQFYQTDSSSTGAMGNPASAHFPPYQANGDVGMMDLSSMGHGSISNIPAPRESWTRTMLN